MFDPVVQDAVLCTPRAEPIDPRAMSRHDLETTLAAIWADLLAIDEVGLHENFLLLGGESLLATQVASEIRARFGREVPIRSIFVGTVAQIAAELQGESTSASPAPACTVETTLATA